VVTLLLAGGGQHLALVLAAELADDVGMGEHGLCLPVGVAAERISP
jgi:hypothetical protein